MWLAGSKVDVYVGTLAVALDDGGDRILAFEVGSFAAALEQLRVWCQERAVRTRLRVWLSGGLARPFVLPQVVGVKGTVEVRQIAHSLVEQSTGLAGECAVWVDAKLPIAIAVQDATLELLTAACVDAPRPHKIVSIRPWWSGVLRWVLNQDSRSAALAVQDCDSLTVLAGRDEGFEVATTLSPVTDTETADAALVRQVLATGIADSEWRMARLLPRRAQGGRRHDGLALSPWVEWVR